MRMILHSFYQRMTQSRLSSIFIPCLRKLRALNLISPSLKVCGWVAGLALDWSPSKLKILGIYVGLGNLEEDNWGPRICAVEKTLLSWPQRSLSFRGKALVINAFALSRIWYVASLVVGSQAGVVDINHAFHLYYKCCMWIEFQSIST